MAEPNANAFKQKKPTDVPAAGELKGVKIAPVENYKHAYTFGSGDKLYIDKKRNTARVVGEDKETVAEGKFRRPKSSDVIVIIDGDADYEVGFKKDGLPVFYPKIKTE